MNQWMLIRRMRGPAFLVLIGVMFLLNEWDVIGFHRSWPLLLILAGVLSLAERAALSRVNPAQVNAGVPGNFSSPNYAGYGPGVPVTPAAGTYAPATGLVSQDQSPSSELPSDKGRL